MSNFVCVDGENSEYSETGISTVTSSSGISKTQKGQKSPILRVDSPIKSEIPTKIVTSEAGNFSLDRGLKSQKLAVVRSGFESPIIKKSKKAKTPAKKVSRKLKIVRKSPSKSKSKSKMKSRLS